MHIQHHAHHNITAKIIPSSIVARMCSEEYAKPLINSQYVVFASIRQTSFVSLANVNASNSVAKKVRMMPVCFIGVWFALLEWCRISNQNASWNTADLVCSC